MFNETDIILAIYRGLISKNTASGIPVNLRPARIVGTVQDDPFDCWIEDEIKKTLPDSFGVFHSGQLTTPDLVVRDKKTGLIVGLEIKKLIQNDKGKAPRGMTIDYNSCLPCGQAMVKVGGETNIVPCYYLFALLSPESDKIITLIILDGDFINYDFELHKEGALLAIDEEDDTRIISTVKKAEKAGGLYLALAGTLVKPTDDIDTDKEYQLIALPE